MLTTLYDNVAQGGLCLDSRASPDKILHSVGVYRIQQQQADILATADHILHLKVLLGLAITKTHVSCLDCWQAI